LSGEEVIIHTREGGLRLSIYKPQGASVLGRCREQILRADDNLDEPSTRAADWV
jgi:hypothetical protein